MLNTCFNALDRHVRGGRGDQAALIYDSPVTGSQRTYTYAELLDEVARFAGVLRGLGVGKGDRVIIYMPMIPEAVIAMLACARIGAVHSVVFGGFAAPELAARIDDAEPKVVVSASCGIEVSRVIEYKPILDRAIDLASHKPGHCVILQRPQAAAALTDGPRPGLGGRGGRRRTRRTACRSRRPIPSTSCTPPGTTARPKGVVRDNGGHAVALRWSMGNIYDTGPGEVFWAASDVGWVVGHSYIVYAPLLAGCTTVLYEGKPVGTPDAGAFWRVVGGAQGQDAVHRADRVPRDQEGGPGRQAGPAVRPVQASGTCSWPGSGWTPRRTTGPASCSASRSSTTGGRPRPAGRSPPT